MRDSCFRMVGLRAREGRGGGKRVKKVGRGRR